MKITFSAMSRKGMAQPSPRKHESAEAVAFLRKNLSSIALLTETSAQFGSLGELLKNLSRLSFRRADGDEESRKPFIHRTRFLAEFTLSRNTGILPLRCAPRQNDTRRARHDKV